MRAPALRPLAAVLLLTLAACAAHDKAGDKAAAVGDWKTAYVEYRQAVASDEKNPQLRARYEEARQKALAQSSSQARACAAQQSWDCALNEAQFALSIEPANLELGNLRSEAAHYVALSRVKAAEVELGRGNLQGSRSLLLEARRLASDGAVDAAAGAVERRWVGAAVAESERARQARRYPEAVALLTAAADYDPSLRPQIDRLEQEFEGFKAGEFLRLSQEGDQLMARGAFVDAGTRYHAALQQKPDERVRAAERYCGLCVQGDQAVSRGDYGAATSAYRDAAALRVDRAGYADAQLARVAVRPWAVTVRGLLIDPVRPEGTPWQGQPNRAVAHAARELSASAGRGIDARLLRIAADVPRENRPALAVEAVLPDGRRLGSVVRDGPYVNLDATFYVMANGFDRRRLTLRVVHREPGQPMETVGEVAMAVGELIGRPTGSVSAPPVLAMELQVDPADGAAEGPGRGFAPVGEGPRPPPPPPAKKK